jgi:hypothetical protein
MKTSTKKIGFIGAMAIIAMISANSSFAQTADIVEQTMAEIVAQQNKQIERELSSSIKIAVADEVSKFTINKKLLWDLAEQEKIITAKTEHNIHYTTSINK